jgi:hypothetical protein
MVVVDAAINMFGWDPLAEVTERMPLWKVRAVYAGRVRKAAVKEGVGLAEVMTAAEWGFRTGRSVRNPLGLVWMVAQWRDETAPVRERPVAPDVAELNARLNVAIEAERTVPGSVWLPILVRTRGREAQADVLAEWEASRAVSR